MRIISNFLVEALPVRKPKLRKPTRPTTKKARNKVRTGKPSINKPKVQKPLHKQAKKKPALKMKPKQKPTKTPGVKKMGMKPAAPKPAKQAKPLQKPAPKLGGPKPAANPNKKGPLKFDLKKVQSPAGLPKDFWFFRLSDKQQVQYQKERPKSQITRIFKNRPFHKNGPKLAPKKPEQLPQRKKRKVAPIGPKEVPKKAVQIKKKDKPIEAPKPIGPTKRIRPKQKPHIKPNKLPTETPRPENKEAPTETPNQEAPKREAPIHKPPVDDKGHPLPYPKDADGTQRKRSHPFYKDDFKNEKEEFARVSKEVGIPINELRSAYEDAKPELLDDKVWSRLENTDSYDTDSWDSVDELGKSYGRDVDKIKDAIKSRTKLPAPIILTDEKGSRHILVGGNTRLMAARAAGIMPQVTIVKVPKLPPKPKSATPPHDQMKRPPEKKETVSPVEEKEKDLHPEVKEPPKEEPKHPAQEEIENPEPKGEKPPPSDGDDPTPPPPPPPDGPDGPNEPPKPPTNDEPEEDIPGTDRRKTHTPDFKGDRRQSERREDDDRRHDQDPFYNGPERRKRARRGPEIEKRQLNQAKGQLKSALDKWLDTMKKGMARAVNKITFGQAQAARNAWRFMSSHNRQNMSEEQKTQAKKFMVRAGYAMAMAAAVAIGMNPSLAFHIGKDFAEWAFDRNRFEASLAKYETSNVLGFRIVAVEAPDDGFNDEAFGSHLTDMFQQYLNDHGKMDEYGLKPSHLDGHP